MLSTYLVSNQDGQEESEVARAFQAGRPFIQVELPTSVSEKAGLGKSEVFIGKEGGQK